MFHWRTLNNKINCLHERALRIVYSDYKSLFCELLEKDKLFSIHHKNIQSLAIEIYKFYIIYHLVLWITYLKSIKLSLLILGNETFFKVEIQVL